MDGHRVDTVCVYCVQSCLSQSLLSTYARVYLSSTHDFAACVSVATSRDNVLRFRSANHFASICPALLVAQAVQVLAGQQEQLACQIKKEFGRNAHSGTGYGRSFCDFEESRDVCFCLRF